MGGKDCYEVCAKEGLLLIKGSSPSAICYAFNKYLRYACGSMVTWGGKHLELPKTWPDWYEKATSPYQFRYFLNVCTFGYTTPYWGWDRWSEELDWMALHGVNMPLASVASEAIARRVWAKTIFRTSENFQNTQTRFCVFSELPKISRTLQKRNASKKN